MRDLSKEWAQFGNINIDENESIEQSFLHFPLGTDRMTVWHWFDDNDAHGMAHLMGITP